MVAEKHGGSQRSAHLLYAIPKGKRYALFPGNRYTLFPELLYMPQRSAAVWTGASHQPVVSSSSMVSVIEQPAMSSEVT